MTHNPDDPKLTAYVLGELAEPERKAVEAHIAECPTCRETVEQARTTAHALGEALTKETAAGLSLTQHREIEEKLRQQPAQVTSRTPPQQSAPQPAPPARPQPTARRSLARRLWPVWIGSAAALLVLGAAAYVFGPQTWWQSTDTARKPILVTCRARNDGYLGCESADASQPWLHGGKPSGMCESSPYQKAERNGEKKAWDAREVDWVNGPQPAAAQPVSLIPPREEPQPDIPRIINHLRDLPPRATPPDFNTEAYDGVVDNKFLLVTENPLSTFSIDVDTASYANIRRFLREGQLPPKDAVRIEEMINYFSYDYPQPTDASPFSTTLEIAGCPWNLNNRLIRIGLKGREIPRNQRPVSNLVFLLDVSGSMQPPNKLPLVKQAMKLLVNSLNENDRLAIVVYAGAAGLVLPSTTCDRKEAIFAALDKLQAGGCTQGSAGIQLAYDTATANFIKGGCNRVILCTDGDFNVGITDQGQLTRLIEEKAKTGVFLSIFGFGMGNLKDSTLEKLADKGNGNYGYIDSLNEAQKALVDQMSGTLVTIAKDVKIQIEFNPVKVAAYRLIGYENRVLAKEDFNDDKKDAGEIGAGHTMTALYEVVPAGGDVEIPGVDPLRYQKPSNLTSAAGSGEIMMLKLRYRAPDSDYSLLQEFVCLDGGTSYLAASEDFKFAAAVAAFGMILRDSPYKGNATLAGVPELAEEGTGGDKDGYRAEFIKLVKLAKARMGR